MNTTSNEETIRCPIVPGLVNMAHG